MSSIPFILTLIAMGLTLVTAITGKVPLWISALLVEIALLVGFK